MQEHCNDNYTANFWFLILFVRVFFVFISTQQKTEFVYNHTITSVLWNSLSFVPVSLLWNYHVLLLMLSRDSLISQFHQSHNRQYRSCVMFVIINVVTIIITCIIFKHHTSSHICIWILFLFFVSFDCIVISSSLDVQPVIHFLCWFCIVCILSCII